MDIDGLIDQREREALATDAAKIERNEEREAIVREAGERLRAARDKSSEWFTERESAKPAMYRNEDDLVSVTLTASEWLYIQDALYRASSDLMRTVRRLALTYTNEGMPMDFDIHDMSMHYVEAIRFRNFYGRISETLIDRNKADNDGD